MILSEEGNIDSLSAFENIAQGLVFSSPHESAYLNALGQAQLNQFDKSPIFNGKESKLKDAKETFLTCIATEEDTYTPKDEMSPHETIIKQEWYQIHQKWISRLKELDKKRELDKKPTETTSGVKKAAAPTKTATASKAAAAPKAAPGKAAPAVKETSKQTTVKAAPEKAKPASVTASSAKKPVATKPETKPAEAPVVVQETKAPKIQKKKSYEPRLGLARTLTRFLQLGLDLKPPMDPKPQLPEIKKWYKESIALKNDVHDAYIELAGLCEKYESIASAIDVYATFPFPADKPSQDDLYIYGELNRLLMKEKNYKNPLLVKSLIAEGKSIGIKSLNKYIETLDAANEAKLLMQVYAGVNGKAETDSDMVSFFKSKFWL
jgi:hypothetical protein